MSEQILYVGDEQLKLKPPRPDLKLTIAENKKMTLEYLDYMRATGKQALRASMYLPHEQFFMGEIDGYDIWQGNEADRNVYESQIANIRGQIVLDAGNGLEPEPFQKFLKLKGAKGYIGVDFQNTFEDQPSFLMVDLGRVSELPETDDFPARTMIRGDIIETVSRLGDGSVSIALNAFESDFMRPDAPNGIELMSEILRTLHPSGMVFGTTTGSGPNILEELSKLGELDSVTIDLKSPNKNGSTAIFFLRRNKV